MLQLTSYVSLCRRNCIAVSGGREQAMEVREERGLPGFRARQPEHWLSPVGPQDRPEGKERGSERRQRPEGDLPEAPLEPADQIVQEADEAEGGLGPREAPGAEPIRPEGVLEFLDAILAVGPAIVHPPHRLRGEREGGHDGVEPVAGDLEEHPAPGGPADGQLLPDHDDPPRPGPPSRLEHELGDLEARGEGPEGEAAHAGLEEARKLGRDGIGERGRLQGGEDRHAAGGAAKTANRGWWEGRPRFFGLYPFSAPSWVPYRSKTLESRSRVYPAVRGGSRSSDHTHRGSEGARTVLR